MYQSPQFGRIFRDYPTIEPNIHPTLTLCSLEFLLQSSDSGGGRDGVQRHINDRRHTPKGSSLGAGIETLPFSPARLVQMDVSINQPRQENVGRIVGIGRPHGELRCGNHGVENRSDLAGTSRQHDGG